MSEPKVFFCPLKDGRHVEEKYFLIISIKILAPLISEKVFTPRWILPSSIIKGWMDENFPSPGPARNLNWTAEMVQLAGLTLSFRIRERPWAGKQCPEAFVHEECENGGCLF